MEQTIEQVTDKLIDEMRCDLNTSINCNDQEISNYDERDPGDLGNEETHQDEDEDEIHQNEDDQPMLV
jgi:hypothetical protein